MPKAKIAKYCFFALLYSLLVVEITATSGFLDPRSFFWPSTAGHFTYVMESRFFACYGYQYNVQGKMLEGSQLLPVTYKDMLKPKQIIVVHYDDKNPEKSFFEPGFNPIVGFTVLFVILLGVLLLFIPFMSWIAISAKNKL